MSMGLSQLGASTRALAFAMAQQGRVDMREVLAVAAADRMQAGALKAVQPPMDSYRTTDQIRDRVMTERGVDRVTLMHLGPQARIEAEVSINAAAAARARQAAPRATGNLLDIRA